MTQSAGSTKDTLRNIRATREFVVNAASRDMAAAATSAPAASGAQVADFEIRDATWLPADKISAPRLAESPIHLECVAVDLLERPGGADVTLVLGRVLRFHVLRKAWRDGAVDS